MSDPLRKTWLDEQVTIRAWETEQFRASNVGRFVALGDGTARYTGMAIFESKEPAPVADVVDEAQLRVIAGKLAEQGGGGWVMSCTRGTLTPEAEALASSLGIEVQYRPSGSAGGA